MIPTTIFKTFFLKKLCYFFSTVILSIGVVDFAVAIFQRYSKKTGHGSIGYAAHIGGGLAGIFVGMNVLRNFHHKVSNSYFYIEKWTGKIMWRDNKQAT